MRKKFTPFYLADFRRDLREIFDWSDENFGVAAGNRYRELIRQALRDALEEPTRPGARARSDLAPHVYVYHLTHSRDRVDGERVKTPRHFVLYRHVGDTVEFVRLLHDSRDLALHVPASFRVR